MKGSALFAVLIFGMNAVSLHFYGGLNSLGAVIERSLAVTIRFLVLIESFSVFFLGTQDKWFLKKDRFFPNQNK